MTVNQHDIVKSYKFKLLPNNQEKEILAQWFGSRRFLYNKFAEIQNQQFENKDKILSNFDLDKLIPQFKKDFPFLKEIPSQALQRVSKDTNIAVKTFFRLLKQGKVNKKFNFKSKYDSKQSISFPNYKDNVKFIHNYHVNKKAKICHIKLPKLINSIKVLKHRNIEGIIKNISLSKEDDCYYISLQTKQSIILPDNKTTSTIGIDLGIKKFVVTSDGETFKPLNAFKTNKDKLAKLQRKLAKLTKKSNNFNKQKKKINKLHHKISLMRKDYLHKISTYLVNNHATIFIENLKIDNMSKSAKGTIENHGKMVKQKSGLNRSILEQGWGIFGDLLEYKSEWKNQTFAKQNPAFSSQECCQCHSKHKDNRVSQSNFVCKNCDNTLNADHNAALNILFRGLIKSGLSVVESQEIIDNKLGRQLFYTNLRIRDGKASESLSSGYKVA